MESISCSYQGRCSGCAWLGIARESQRIRKIESLSRLGVTVHWVDCGDQGLRDRLDMTWEQGRFGLFEVSEDRRILDLETCPMLSPKLKAWYEIYRRQKPPINKGSVRLRVSPEGLRGAWLDFANQDVKALFEERDYLMWLSQQAVVEIGQRRKRLEWVEEKPKLREPKLEPWFETISSNGKLIPLYTTIAGFTQVGFAPNRTLVKEVLRQVEKSQEKSWLELFAGSGNFSLALAASGYSVTAVEVEEAALEGLARSARENGLHVMTMKKDLYRPVELSGNAWLVDPPRLGLRTLMQTIQASKPKKLIYISCWSESFLMDAEHLKTLGYQCTEISGVDQFVHSPHTEWVATFSL